MFAVLQEQTMQQAPLLHTYESDLMIVMQQKDEELAIAMKKKNGAPILLENIRAGSPCLEEKEYGI